MLDRLVSLNSETIANTRELLTMDIKILLLYLQFIGVVFVPCAAHTDDIVRQRNNKCSLWEIRIFVEKKHLLNIYSVFIILR